MLLVRMLLEDRLNIDGIYDPGSQISIINSKLIKLKENKEDMNKVTLKTVNGVTQTNGLTTIKIKIFKIEKEVDVFIVKNDDFEDLEKEVDVFIVKNDDFEDFLIGLHMIKLFRLTQDEN
ncbi:hypothetical protein QE152_g3447 [Popillia japonica]|uniref:Peptidase A2 domain-containing protein n=1 Tax=Popillia japonica TaxID=7064 RepID=A0AAW1N618_POPJA